MLNEFKDAQAELERLSAKMIKQIKLACLIYTILLPRYIVPVFDGQYVQHQDRPATSSVFRMAKYLYWVMVKPQEVN